MQPLISIIVPVYNVEKYICKCIDSIVNQTLKEIEIILIDDGSTDNCPKILDEYAKRDKRIRVFHQRNSGQSSARNKGLDVASGEYIGFVDADDWIELNFYEELYKSIVKNFSDISICSRKVYDIDNNLEGEVILENERIELEYSGLEKYIIKYFFSPYTVSACNKLYKSNLLKNVRFKDVFQVGSEDTLFNYEVLLNINTISSTNFTCYNGLNRIGSTARKYNYGTMIKTGNLIEEMKRVSIKYQKESVWDKIGGIVFLFFQQWNINLIKTYSNEDIALIIEKELREGSKQIEFRKCEKQLAFNFNNIKYMKQMGYSFSGRMFIRLFMLFSYIKLYGLASKIRSLK